MMVGAGDGTGVPNAIMTLLAEALVNPYDISELVTAPEAMADCNFVEIELVFVPIG
jgi:hypothetical protein